MSRRKKLDETGVDAPDAILDRDPEKRLAKLISRHGGKVAPARARLGVPPALGKWGHCEDQLALDDEAAG